MIPPKKSIIFDMDGTLYAFRGGSFKKSGIHKKILHNASLYIASHLAIPKKDADTILGKIVKKYGEDISIGLEKEYNLPRNDYFETTWDIDPKKFVKPDARLKRTLSALSRAKFAFFLVSDAPHVWIEAVLNELGITRYFQNRIFSGEGNKRKGFGNAFRNVIKQRSLNPKSCIAIGDQENTDIIPAKKLGMKTVRVSNRKVESQADLLIRNINEINTRKLVSLFKLDKNS